VARFLTGAAGEPESRAAPAERLCRVLKFSICGIRFQPEPPAPGPGLKAPAAVWAAKVSPVDLPLRLHDVGAPHNTQGQQQQAALNFDHKEQRPSKRSAMIPGLGFTALLTSFSLMVLPGAATEPLDAHRLG
jgi:hypothetical protein